MLAALATLTKNMLYYSGNGDDGKSKLFDAKENLPKSQTIFSVLGSLDELNSYLGLSACEAPQDSFIYQAIKREQENIFICQAHFAKSEIKIPDNLLSDLELSIAKVAKLIKPRDSFVLPGGSRLSALLDIARTLARKCERKALSLSEEERNSYEKIVFVYLNRLSSQLYVLARLANDLAKVGEDTPLYK